MRRARIGRTRAAENDPDNDQSVGFLLKFGKFKFLDLGDLTWNYEKALVCPDNLIGNGRRVSDHASWAGPVELAAVRLGDSAARGGHEQWPAQRRSGRRFRDAAEVARACRISGRDTSRWGHRKEVNTDEKMIANLEPTADCKGNLLKLSVAPDGKYTMTNERNGFTKTYAAK